MDKQELQAYVDGLGFDFKAEFVPWSRSKSGKDKWQLGDLSLNWNVTLRKGNVTLATTYGKGIGHAPSYKQLARPTVDYVEQLRREAEGEASQYVTKYKTLSLADVLASLALDASALDHADFESWAADFGYEADSRAAEKIYKACLDIGLKLRAMLGDDGLTKLREAFQDY